MGRKKIRVLAVLLLIAVLVSGLMGNSVLAVSGFNREGVYAEAEAVKVLTEKTRAEEGEGKEEVVWFFADLEKEEDKETEKNEGTEDKGKEDELAEKKIEEENGSDKTAGVQVSAKSAVLMEARTGKIIYEKNKDMQLMPASITKIMTLLLIYEAMEDGKFGINDEVTVSAHAAGKGGSQAYLEEGEVQTVGDMIKCITIASANDAATAMAEKVSGSEEAFVELMNQKAKELGMEHTHFSNCCGLDDTISEKEHYSCAGDIAIMSRELMERFPAIQEYTTTWMDSIIHRTKRGESEFGLTNTNKLVRFYDGITGLKTGYTSKAGFCLSATASRNGLNLIAVVMAAPDSPGRFEDSKRLLDYGFANLSVYKDSGVADEKYEAMVGRGTKDMVMGEAKEEFVCIFRGHYKEEDVEKKVVLEEKLEAPVKEGSVIGRLEYTYKGKEMGKVEILAKEDVDVAGYGFYLRKFFLKWLL